MCEMNVSRRRPWSRGERKEPFDVDVCKKRAQPKKVRTRLTERTTAQEYNERYFLTQKSFWLEPGTVDVRCLLSNSARSSTRRHCCYQTLSRLGQGEGAI